MAHSDEAAPIDLTVYVDTNCFLQLRELSDVDWRTVAPGVQHVQVAVSFPVIRELDTFKDSPNRRRSDRARKALKVIAAAGHDDNFVTVLRDAAPRVTLRAGVGGRLAWEDHPELDPSSADDQIVLSAKTEDVAGDKLLLTYDHAPLIRGRMLGLPCRKPPEDWLLPRQADERDKEIARLERALVEAKAQWPTLVLGVAGAATTIDWDVLSPPPLDAQQCAWLAEVLTARHPKDALAELPSSVYALPLARQRYTQGQRNEYDASYAAYERAALTYFERLHSWVAARSRLRQIELDLHNTSTVTAARVLVSLRAPEGIVFYGDTPLDLKMGRFEPPKAPRPPEPGSLFGLGAGMAADRRAVIPQIHHGPRDPVAFYWQDRPDGKQATASRLCEEFRALRTFQQYVWMGIADDSATGDLRVEVSATNLPGAITAQTLITVKVVEVTWSDPRILATLPEAIADILMQN